MLRPYFMRDRELLADLARLAYETMKQLMADAVHDKNARPGVTAVPQTFGSVLNPHPHAHCLASRGVWDEKGQWLPVPHIDTNTAEKLFAHKIFRLLKNKDAIAVLPSTRLPPSGRRTHRGSSGFADICFDVP